MPPAGSLGHEGALPNRILTPRMPLRKEPAFRTVKMSVPQSVGLSRYEMVFTPRYDRRLPETTLTIKCAR